MKTSRLITCLSFDLGYSLLSPGRSSFRMVLFFVPISLISSALLLDIRDNFDGAIWTWRYLYKLGIVAAIGMAGFALCNQHCSPPFRGWPHIVSCAVILLGITATCAIEASIIPRDQWGAALIGARSMVCVAMIPLISLPLLVAALLGMQVGAPISPGAAGSAAGLAAGGLGAFIYAFYCDNDSPFYVVAWYIPAIMIVSIIGRFLGRHLLPW